MSIIFSLGKRIRQQRKDEKTNKEEMKTMMPNEEDELLKGIYLNSL